MSHGDVSMTLFQRTLCCVPWSLPRLVPDFVCCAFWEWLASLVSALLAFPMSVFSICPWRSHLSLDKEFLNWDMMWVTLSRISTELWLTLAINLPAAQCWCHKEHLSPSVTHHMQKEMAALVQHESVSENRSSLGLHVGQDWGRGRGHIKCCPSVDSKCSLRRSSCRPAVARNVPSPRLVSLLGKLSGDQGTGLSPEGVRTDVWN